MPADLFNTAALDAWRERLNQSNRFKQAAANWRGRLLLVETGTGPDERAAAITIDNGRCTEARVASPTEVGADFVLAATASTWDDLVTARITPASAALGGRLALRHGNALALLPHASAAAALLAEFHRS